MDASNRRRMLGAALFVVVLALIAALVVVLTDDEASPPATTTTSSSVSTTTLPPGADVSSAVWPVAESSTRYSDPIEAARGFALEYVGFTELVVGEFRQGDSRSGEVSIQAFAGGPTTTAFVRQLDDTWWVLGAATENIQVTAPDALARVTSPVTLDGTSTAFEATVPVEVREDGNPTPLGSGFVMGGANGEFGPFHDTLAFDAPTADGGALVFFTRSAEDGSIIEAAVLRVFF